MTLRPPQMKNGFGGHGFPLGPSRRYRVAVSTRRSTLASATGSAFAALLLATSCTDPGPDDHTSEGQDATGTVTNETARATGESTSSSGSSASQSGDAGTSGSPSTSSDVGSTSSTTDATGMLDSDDDSSGGEFVCPATATLGPGDELRTIDVGGQARTYLLHVPAAYTGESPVPLLLDFHGRGGTGGRQRSTSGMDAVSDIEGFIVAWPDGIDNNWNLGPCCTESRDVDDLGFALAIVDELRREACIDPRRVYAQGFSMGGGMSYLLACNAADVFAAVSPHAFDFAEETIDACVPSRPISVLAQRGTDDAVVPYEGGRGIGDKFTFLGADATLARWVELDGCVGAPTIEGTTVLYTECSEGVQVGLHTIEGGEHGGGSAALSWEFLERQVLP